jgi:hypothetical protein
MCFYRLSNIFAIAATSAIAANRLTVKIRKRWHSEVTQRPSGRAGRPHVMLRRHLSARLKDLPSTTRPVKLIKFWRISRRGSQSRAVCKTGELVSDETRNPTPRADSLSHAPSQSNAPGAECRCRDRDMRHRRPIRPRGQGIPPARDYFLASSTEFVGEFWLGEVAKCVKQGDFDGFVHPKSIRFSDSQFAFVV